MIEVPLWGFVSVLTLLAIGAFCWCMQRLSDWLERRDARLLAQQTELDNVKFGVLYKDLEGWQAHAKKLEEANTSLQSEVCTLITRCIKMSNELRCDPGALTQVLPQNGSARFRREDLQQAADSPENQRPSWLPVRQVE